MALTSADKKKLKAKAQHLEPVVHVGKGGLSAALIASLDKALSDHQLVKVRFSDLKTERKTLAPKLAEATSSDLVTMVGHVVVLFRRNVTSG